MPAPANIRTRLGQLLDAAWDAKVAGMDFSDASQFSVAGQDVVVSIAYEVPLPESYHRLSLYVKWRPLP